MLGLKRHASRAPPIPGVSWIDVDSPGWELRLTAGRPHLVIHAATSYGRRGEGLREIRRSNVDFPLGLLALTANAWGAAFINIDTVLPPNLNDYALTKAEFRGLGKAAAQIAGIPYLDVRLEQMYGPWDDDTKFPIYALRACARNMPILEVTFGEQKRDFIYIDDVLAAIRLIAQEITSPRLLPEKLDVGTGKPVTIRAYIETVHSITGSSTQLNFGAVPYRSGEPMSSVLDVSPLFSLGWRPAMTLEEGIRTILETEGLK